MLCRIAKYGACGPFTKKKDRIQKFVKTGNSRYMCQKELEKTCFKHHMAYGTQIDLLRGTTSD